MNLSRDQLIAGVCLLAGAIFLMATGHPLPHPDDLANSGTAITLGTIGEYQNPYVSEWMAVFPASKPFFYTPGFSYLLGAWIAAFGVSASTMLSFQWLSILTGAISYLIWQRRFIRIDSRLEPILALAYLFAFQRMGLRAEVTAYAFMFAGLATAAGRSRLSTSISYLLLALSGLVYPTAPIIAAPLWLAVFFGKLSQEKSEGIPLGKTLQFHIVSCVVAAAITSLTFYLMIGGEVGEFLRVLQRHKAAATPLGFVASLCEYGNRLNSFGQKYIRLPLHVLAIACMLGVIISAKARRSSNETVITAALLVSVLLSIVTNPYRSSSFVPLLLYPMICMASSILPKRVQLVVPLLLFALVFSVNVRMLAALPFRKSPDVNSLSGMREEARNHVSKGGRLNCDEWAARYVFDYRLPIGTRDLTTFAIRNWLDPNIPQLDYNTIPADELWLASRATLSPSHIIRIRNTPADLLESKGTYSRYAPSYLGTESEIIIVGSPVAKER